jgi:hypothetical protein
LQNSTTFSKSTAKDAPLELCGGEALEGSGFEEQKPSPNFSDIEVAQSYTEEV